MIDTKGKWMERFLQKKRFGKIYKYIKGDSILDFGGNKGELEKYYLNKLVLPYDPYEYYNYYLKYKCCNNIKELGEEGLFDNIVSLAVIEHIEYDNVFPIMRKLTKYLKPKGRIIITTPTKLSILPLEIMSRLGVTDRKNIEEHKHYWSKKELFELADNLDLKVRLYKKFQFGMNQLIVMDLL